MELVLFKANGTHDLIFNKGWNERSLTYFAQKSFESTNLNFVRQKTPSYHSKRNYMIFEIRKELAF
jgi:hypothetical protein